MDDSSDAPMPERWAHLRFSVVGPLLASPPKPGGLRAALCELAKQQWCHPSTGEPTTFGLSTIERWYYEARRERRDPVGALRRRRRSDAGRSRNGPDFLYTETDGAPTGEGDWTDVALRTPFISPIYDQLDDDVVDVPSMMNGGNVPEDLVFSLASGVLL